MAHIFERTPTREQFVDLNTCLMDFRINTPNRMRHFLAQIAHESAGLQYFEEQGNRDYFNYLEGNTDLGNTQPGDGYKFRGVGPLQVTGRKNQTAFGSYINDPTVAKLGTDYVAQKYPFQISSFWWVNLNNMNALCDCNPTVAEVTRRVNGGLNGLAEREYYYRKACEVIL
jgi:putative chitinase